MAELDDTTVETRVNFYGSPTRPVSSNGSTSDLSVSSDETKIEAPKRQVRSIMILFGISCHSMSMTMQIYWPRPFSVCAHLCPKIVHKWVRINFFTVVPLFDLHYEFISLYLIRYVHATPCVPVRVGRALVVHVEI